MVHTLKIIIPAYLEDYITDYHTNWCKKPITTQDIDILALFPRKFKAFKSEHLIEMPYQIITQEEYLLRDTEEVKNSNEVYAFQVNNSVGTQDTIDKARKSGLPISIHKKYSILE